MLWLDWLLGLCRLFVLFIVRLLVTLGLSLFGDLMVSVAYR